jgi:hypothetical protein
VTKSAPHPRTLTDAPADGRLLSRGSGRRFRWRPAVASHGKAVAGLDNRSRLPRLIQRSRSAFSRRKSASLAFRMARVITGAVTAANPEGSPVLRRVISVVPSAASCHV